ncbi:sensor histidine kinase [Maribacter sp. 2308TA10-17]|uniref:sensor histidine kinase n=1 Tax=Maribacter sp. 2308TA10-17 TaxID=3386276 RepID=UPI0039BD0953
MSISKIDKSNTKWSFAFWLVQLIGWGGVSYLGYLFSPTEGGWRDSSYFAFAIWAGLFIGLFATGLLRAYLKRNVLLDKFDSKELKKVVGAIIIATIIYAGLSYGTGFLKGYFDLEKVEVPKMYENLGLGFVIFNSFMTIFVWTIFYMSVKIAFKLNANRLERAELNATIRQAQLNTLKGQINPHFMFNSLNNIRGLMLEDVDKSRDMLTKLSEMLRYSLTKNDVNAIALEEELEMIDNYISLSKIQFEDRLEFVQEIAPETLKTSIPPMTIQLLVENAAKHGISNLKDGGIIKLTTKHVDDHLEIEVNNTGKLKIDSKSTQLGLKNIKQRLRLLYGERASFSLEEMGNEVLAKIKIPLT